MIGSNEKIGIEIVDNKDKVLIISQSKLDNFFKETRPARFLNDSTPTKRVKSVSTSIDLEGCGNGVLVERPLRAPSPVILSPNKMKEIADRKLECLQRMEAKRMTRICALEFSNIPESWLKVLEAEFGKAYFVRLKEFLQGEWDRSVKVFPVAKNIYSWTTFCPINQVKVVILGQDPYHNDGQAMGLAFSVPRDFRPLPPSLRNIYKELTTEFPETFTAPKHGCLESWARQGVLLLNATLTVRAHEAASHANRGWELFTDQVISQLNGLCDNLVFLLWGNHAQKKSTMINKQKHLVLTAAHPSPLSASRGFFGCGHFKRANEFLVEKELDPVEWHNFD